MNLVSRSVFAAVLIVFATIALADPRPFTFTYDTYAEGKGNVEFEQWFTYQTHKDADPSFSSYNFKEEIEFGLADNFDFSIYIPSWRYENTDEHTGTQFDSVGFEAIFYALNPVTDPIGLGLYTEVNIGEEELEFEFKLLLQKDWRNWTFAYNLILETEVEGVFHNETENETEGVFGNSFGASYALNKHLALGAEGLVESIYENWNHYEDTVFYLGPTISYAASEHWWIAATPFFQVTSVDEEPDFQLRMVAGYVF